MNVHFFATGDFREGNAANSRFLCYGKGLNEQNIDCVFHFILPSEFNDTGINKDIKGVYQGINFDYLCNTTKRPRFFLSKIFILCSAWVRAFGLIFGFNRNNSIAYFYGPQALVEGPIILFCRLFRIKVIVEKTELHSIADEKRRTFKSVLIKSAYRIIENNLDVLCHKVVVISRRLKRYYAQKIPVEKIAEIPILVDTRRFENLPTPSRTERLGYLGSFGHKDGVEGIIQSFAEARNTMPSLKLRLIGFQTRSFKLQECLRENGLSLDDPSLEITGQVGTHEIPRLLAECDLLLLNRVQTNYANYGFPTKLGEYLASGRPVISTNISDVAYHFNDGDDLKIIEPDNAKLLTDTILERYSKYEAYSEMGLNGKHKGASLFSYNKHTETLIRIFQEVLEKKKPTLLKPAFQG